jgi:hypothetical protein
MIRNEHVPRIGENTNAMENLKKKSCLGDLGMEVKALFQLTNNRIQLLQDVVQWRVLVNKIVNDGFHEKMRNVLTR